MVEKLAEALIAGAGCGAKNRQPAGIFGLARRRRLGKCWARFGGWKLRVSIIAAALLGSIVTTAQAAPFIVCKAAGAPTLVIEQNARVFDGKSLACFSGGDFADGLTPCAPENGYGLSEPTGAGELARIVDRWTADIQYEGGVVYYVVRPTRYAFGGGYSTPENGVEYHWDFSVDRLTGKGTLSTIGDPPNQDEMIDSPFGYDCALTSRKP